MSIQDPDLNYHYVDYYYFSYMSDTGSEGQTVWRWVMVSGRSPVKYRPTSMITVAGTIDANIALDMPQGISGLSTTTWNNLTDDEKKFVIEHTEFAIAFLLEANEALSETANQFSNTADGTAANAFQHAYWNALMAQDALAGGHPEYAQQYASAHENYPHDAYHPNPLRDMDLANNSVGRQIGLNNPDATKQELVNLVKQALNSGQLTYVCPSAAAFCN